ncbi:MAG: aldo/keto reductase [Eubacteriales bacterium]|nr:aldo/keto reductase [Eubacteriales bacterium]
MKQRKLGELTVSEIGMGCMGFSHGYGHIPEEEYSIEAIRMAYEYGCTFYDTAEVYSPNLQGIGHNERIVGKALLPVRNHVVLATKLFLGTEEAGKKGVYETLRHHLEGSMERLQTDYIDLYYLHHLNPDIPVEEVAEGMGRLIREGVIRAWGLSNVGVKAIAKAHAVTPVSAVQNIYSMMERDCEDAILPYCMENGIGVVPFSPIASGFLSGKITPETKFESEDDVRNVVPQLSGENVRANQPLVGILKEYAAQKQATPAQISLAWMLCKYPHVVPIPGSKNKERILENLGAWEVELTQDEFAALEEALDSCTVHGHRGCVELE